MEMQTVYGLLMAGINYMYLENLCVYMLSKC